MVKMFDDEALKPLVNIINDIIYNGLIPNSFKLSIITPIHKKGSKTNVENYRPISLLTTFSKIFERVIKLRLANYLEENMLLPPTQFGFRKGFSTEHGITSLTQTILDYIDTKKKNDWNIHVSEQSILSESKTMICGVPQGTVLSPLLYIIYVLELSNLKLDGSIYSYADDTALVVTGETWQSVAKIAENSLSKIIEWFSNNNLSLNYNKTVYFTF
ncbi:unnamed protein product [Macrosiphum euphorbiae]|uniref:Reverse transcriptase domain-containing protein n=1 Tax=Macrosiphum euphorbiae TaxID=13131 RepID=A0AAV0XR73_9HEMI|nr:unnamed protein product [Macrosiphum euphorbiae]